MHDELLCEALRELLEAYKAMVSQTAPSTPMPRPKVFKLAKNTYWPRLDADGVEWHVFVVGKEQHNLYFDGKFRTSDSLLAVCGHQPRKVLRCLRRIQAATAWCYARAEGRKRAAEEILRQQQGAADTLKAEAAMQALGKEGSK